MKHLESAGRPGSEVHICIDLRPHDIRHLIPHWVAGSHCQRGRDELFLCEVTGEVGISNAPRHAKDTPRQPLEQQALSFKWEGAVWTVSNWVDSKFLRPFHRILA